MKTESTELLAPAGDFETALAAFSAGADAVYCGLERFSARAFAKNLSSNEFASLVRYAHSLGKKVYATVNTLVDDDGLEDAAHSLATLADAQADGVIVQDLGIARMARKYFPTLALHASTQLVAHNLEGVLALKELGFTRVVLARELSFEEISSIVKRCGVEIECFIHGALCYSVSGLCLYSALEKGRSGNRGMCAYCCREKSPADGSFPFSMKDMRLAEDVRRLAEAHVASLKIEGRMKSALYVASATQYYRDKLDGLNERTSLEDLETVFSRRTTKLYFNGRQDDVIDPSSLGHLGAKIGVVKRITRDRQGRRWLRFHTLRALEKHDGLQFSAHSGGKPWGFGISAMREAISRRNVFEVAPASDVEVLFPDDAQGEAPRPGDAVYCSMSNALKRRFPVPGFRPSAFPGVKTIDVAVRISKDGITAHATLSYHPVEVDACIDGVFESAKIPANTFPAVEKAFSKLGDSAYSPGRITLEDPDRLYAPMGVLNELRRRIVSKLDDARKQWCVQSARQAVEAEAAPHDDPLTLSPAQRKKKYVKVHSLSRVPQGDWDEVIVAGLSPVDTPLVQRLALPVWIPEPEMNKVRSRVKTLVRQGFDKWECADLAGLRMLKALGIEDITCDWTLYALNRSAIAALMELGLRRIVASPESSVENTSMLASCGMEVESISRQSTPLFISLHKPVGEIAHELVSYCRDGLWITTRREPRYYDIAENTSERVDFSWDV